MRRSRFFVPAVLFIATVVVGLVIPGILLRSRGAGQDTVSFAYRTLTPSPGNILSYVDNPNTSLTQADGSAVTPIVVTPDQNKNCTYSLFYWVDHPERWPAQIVFGGRPYTSEVMKPLLETTPTDISTLLVREAYVVFINILQGADSTDVQTYVVLSSTWLTDNPPGSTPSELNTEIGSRYLQALQQFNDGVTGPGLCPDHPPTQTPTLASQAIVPSAMPTPTPEPGITQPPARPTAPPVPYRSPTPTERHSPPNPPTSTPVPPTSTQAPPPPPTDTQPPPPTATPPPPPTATLPPPPPPTEPPPTPTVPPEG